MPLLSEKFAEWIINWAGVGLILVNALLTGLLWWANKSSSEHYNAKFSKLNGTITSLNNTVGESNLTLKQSKDAITSLEKAIVDAYKLLEADRIAREKIEKSLAGRSLTPNQIEIIANKLKPYQHTRLWIQIVPDDFEANEIARSITVAIQSGAKWEVHIEHAPPRLHPIYGIKIETMPHADSKFEDIAWVLYNALEEEGLLVDQPFVGMPSTWPSTPEGDRTIPILVTIGSKPQPWAEDKIPWRYGGQHAK